MTKRKPDGSNAVLAVKDWPAEDQTLWRAALTTSRSPFRSKGGGRAKASATAHKFASGYGRFIGFLNREHADLLDRSAANRVPDDVLDAYFEHLKASGNANTTIVQRFVELRFALQWMYPGRNFRPVTHPNGVSLTALLPMEHHERPTWNAAVLFVIAETLFEESVQQSDPWRRRSGVRDAVIMGMLVDHAQRRRTLIGMRLGKHVYRLNGTWMLEQSPEITKTGPRTGRSLVMPIDPLVASWLERYLTVERVELLSGRTDDALWLSNHGTPLAYQSLGESIALRTKRVLGTAVRPHAFRASLATTEAMDGTADPLDAMTILNHSSPSMTIEHYNRANAIAASRRHAARLKRLRERRVSD